MKYLGGKARSARQIVDTMTLYAPTSTKWVEPFVGGAWVLEAAAKSDRFDSLHAGDVLPDLILLYRAAAAGWVPPRAFTRADHDRLKFSEPSPERALVGFGSSFAGEFFAGFCGDKINSHSAHTNAELAADHIIRRRALFAATDLRVADYRDWEPEIGPGTLLYCDPPYANTRPYPGRPKFDSDEFWGWTRRMAERGADVFVSEYGDGPEFAEVVWERTARQTAGKLSNPVRVERLFRVPAPALVGALSIHKQEEL